jgi:nitrite reductase/ring-hydroxylating ferredoxin subunit
MMRSSTPSGYTQTLICATHGALYERATGVCVGRRGCGASLEAVAVREHDGGVYCVED